MDEMVFDLLEDEDEQLPVGARQAISGTYTGQRGASRLVLRLDLREPNPSELYTSLNLVSGDIYHDIGDEDWDYRYSFIVEHPRINWGGEHVLIAGVMIRYHNLELDPEGQDPIIQQRLRVVLPVRSAHEPPAPATVQIIHWGNQQTTFLCDKDSPYFRTIELEIDRITDTQLPRSFDTESVTTHPPDLPRLNLDIQRAYHRAGIDMRVVSDSEILAPVEAGSDLKWNEDELHNAMEHHFSLWRDEPQWKLYLLIATHFRLYPQYLVTGIMYDSQYRNTPDPFPRQGAAAFYTTMQQSWSDVSEAEFDRNYLRTCVHELGHALNLLHTFDKDRPSSLSWMNYPWRYPYGYNLPPGWNGTEEYWQQCRFEFDAEELRHLRHHALMEVIPGGAAFGVLGHEMAVPMAVSPQSQETAPAALYVRTRPERYLFDFAEPVTVEVKLKNQTSAPMVVPHMLNPEFGLLDLYVRDPKGRVRRYRPLFKLCGEGRTAELLAGESLYESVFVAYGAEGFYFEEPGEYHIWAVYGAGGLRLRSNALRIRVAFPATPDDEKIALWTFGQEQGHVLYMRGADHLQSGTEQLMEVTKRYPTTHLSRYIHYCFGSSQSRDFKDVISGQVRPPQPEAAARELREASKLLRETQRSGLDNITHGRAVDLLYECYQEIDKPKEAETILSRTARYFKRMDVKQSIIQEIETRIDSLKAK